MLQLLPLWNRRKSQDIPVPIQNLQTLSLCCRSRLNIWVTGGNTRWASWRRASFRLELGDVTKEHCGLKWGSPIVIKEAHNAVIQQRGGFAVNCIEATMQWGKWHNNPHLLKDKASNAKRLRQKYLLFPAISFKAWGEAIASVIASRWIFGSVYSMNPTEFIHYASILWGGGIFFNTNALLYIYDF